MTPDELKAEALTKLAAARKAAEEGAWALCEALYGQALDRFKAAGIGTAERHANGWTA